MADLATLGTRFVTEGAEASERAMDGVANAADRVEAATDGAAAATKRAGAAMGEAAPKTQQFASATERLAAEQEAAIKTAQRLNAVHGSAISTSKTLQYATLNLGRQFSDVGVSLASGMNPLMVFIQQGPQVVDIFSQMKTEGIGAKQALTQIAMGAVDMVKKFAPLIGTGAILGGVALAAYGVWTEIKKTQQAMKDLEAATNEANAAIANARETMKEASLGAGTFGQESLGAAFGIKSFAGEVGDAAIKLYDFAAAAKTATVNGLMAQRVALSEKISKLEERSTEGRRSALTGPWTPARIAEKLGNRIGGDLLSLWTGGESDRTISNDIGAAKSAMKELEAALTDVLNKDLKGWADEGRAALGDLGKKTKEQVKELAGLKPFDESKLLKATNEVWPYMAGVIQATEKRTRDLNAATQELDHSLGRVRIPSDLENLATVLDDQSRAARELRYDIEDIAYAINNNDWTSAFAGMARVLMQVKAAFEQGATSAQKYAAAAAVAGAVGGAIGGTTGATISGAASGAMTGFTLAGPAGAVVGGILGGIGGLLGSSKAKKQRRAQEAAQRAAEEAQRQQTIADTQFGLDVAILRAQGKEQEALTKERDKEIARLQALSPALVDSQKQLWALEDAATAAAAAAEKAAAIEAKRQSIQDQIDKLTLSDSELLAKTRAKERAEAVALDPALGDLIDKLYGLQDSAAASERATAALQAANDAATRAAEQQASVMQGLADTFGGVVNGVMDLTRSLNEFGDSLGRPDFSALSPKQAYAASKAALNDALATGQFDLVQALGQAFVEASKAINGGSAAYIQDRAYAQSIAYSAAAANQGRLSGIGSIFSSLRGFATGGEMVIGGNTGLDRNILSINDAPVARVNYGETLAIRPAGANDNSSAALVAEVRALRAEVSALRASNDRIDRNTARMDRNIDRVTEGGEAMITTGATA